MRVSFLPLSSSLCGGELRLVIFPVMGQVPPLAGIFIHPIINDSLPGAVGMYALSLGIQNIGQTLPLPVYALLSGLNASIVGIIALAAVQLADKAIRDKLTRIQVLFGACAGVCYNTLWYFPILMLAGGLASVIWDGWMAQQVRRLKLAWQRRHSRPAEPEDATISSGADGEIQSAPVEMQEMSRSGQGSNADDSQQTALVRSRKATLANEARIPRTLAPTPAGSARTQEEGQPSTSYSIRIRIGILIVVLFFGRIFIRCSWCWQSLYSDE